MEITHVIPEVYYSKEAAQAYEDNKRMQKIQVEMAERALELLELSRGKVLDAGCGTGFSTQTIKDAGFDVTGIDVAEPMLEIARNKGLEAIKASFDDLPFNDGEFDAVICISSLQWIYGKSANEVIDKFNSVAKEFHRVLKDRGRAVVQFYPKTPAEFDITINAFKRAGFRITIATDYPDSPKKTKSYIILQK